MKLVVVSGYCNFGSRTCQRLNSALDWLKFALAILLAQTTASSCRYFALAISLPLGARHTPNVHHASNGSSWGMVIHSDWFIIMLIVPCTLVEVLYFHCWYCHLKSTKYQKHFSGMSLLPVAYRSLCHIVSNWCIFWSLSLYSCWSHLLSCLYHLQRPVQLRPIVVVKGRK